MQEDRIPTTTEAPFAGAFVADGFRARRQFATTGLAATVKAMTGGTRNVRVVGMSRVPAFAFGRIHGRASQMVGL